MVGGGVRQMLTNADRGGEGVSPMLTADADRGGGPAVGDFAHYLSRFRALFVSIWPILSLFDSIFY